MPDNPAPEGDDVLARLMETASSGSRSTRRRLRSVHRKRIEEITSLKTSLDLR